jgi:hypothetical protein
MIGYRISRQQLEKLIEEQSPGWMGRAKTRTSGFEAQRRFSEPSSKSIWSEVKPVYMKLQGDSKCAFCERKLESVDFGKGEQAVEHFRPKGRVSSWRIPARLKRMGIAIAAPPTGQGGYFMLAYNLFNYSAACNPCNSALKRDYFPIVGTYQLAGTSPESLLKEQPLLIYPIGDFDAEPEELIRFNGVSPYAAGASQYERERGLVTIEFFQLDSLKRTSLLLERARIIETLFMALEALGSSDTTPSRKAQAQSLIKQAKSHKAPHANCARSFCSLFAADRSAAAEISAGASNFVDSKS